VEEIEDANAGEGLRVDVCEDGGETLGVHGAELSEDEVELGERVDDDECIGDLQCFRVPREHPFSSSLTSCRTSRLEAQLTQANTGVSKSVVRDKVNNLIQLALLLGVLGVKLPETVQPGNLNKLLGEEEAANKVRLRTPERYVSIIDILHGWCAVETILLSSEIEEERCGCEPFGGAV
jgi:hypothetical protein